MDNAAATTPTAREFVAFRAGEQDFCIDIMSVREIRSAVQTTNLPHSPPYIVGLINLRGMVMPVVNLAMRLGLAPRNSDIQHVIVVVWIGSQLVGLEVDDVSDILSVGVDALRPAPDGAGIVVGHFVKTVMTVGERLVCVLSLESILESDEAEAA
jgi:purine-binding chemotaxis protein CheW